MTHTHLSSPFSLLSPDFPEIASVLVRSSSFCAFVYLNILSFIFLFLRSICLAEYVTTLHVLHERLCTERFLFGGEEEALLKKMMRFV